MSKRHWVARQLDPYSIKDSGFPKKYLNILNTEWEGDIPNVDMEKNKGYFFTGGAGTGKTMFACICAKRIYTKDENKRWVNNISQIPEHTCKFVSVPEFLMEIQDTFNTEQLADDVISYYANASYLILDDLGAEKATEWAIQMLYVLIDRRERMGNNKIIITSNYTLDEIAGKLSDRIASRISGMCEIIKFRGKDHRAK